MPICKKCGHPHAWYDGLCKACAQSGETVEPSIREVEVEAAREKKEVSEPVADVKVEAPTKKKKPLVKRGSPRIIIEKSKPSTTRRAKK